MVEHAHTPSRTQHTSVYERHATCDANPTCHAQHTTPRTQSPSRTYVDVPAPPSQREPLWSEQREAAPPVPSQLRRQIFCNRSLNMKQIKSIGFDVSWWMVVVIRCADAVDLIAAGALSGSAASTRPMLRGRCTTCSLSG